MYIELSIVHPSGRITSGMCETNDDASELLDEMHELAGCALGKVGGRITLHRGTLGVTFIPFNQIESITVREVEQGEYDLYAAEAGIPKGSS